MVGWLGTQGKVTHLCVTCRRVDQIREEQKKDTRTLQLGLLQAEVAGIKTQVERVEAALCA